MTTPADHANTVRDALLPADHDPPCGFGRCAPHAALDALQVQAETAEEPLEREVRLLKRAEAAEAERDHARDALRELDDQWHLRYEQALDSRDMARSEHDLSVRERDHALQERDHAQDALRQIANWPFDTMVRGDEDGEIKRVARAALGNKP